MKKSQSQSLHRLVGVFLEEARKFDRSFLTLGKIRFEIEAVLGGPAFKILLDAGASKASVSNAKYGADAWGRVVAGEMTAGDFEDLSFEFCRTIASARHPVRAILDLRDIPQISDSQVVALAKADVPTADLKRVAAHVAAEGISARLLDRAIDVQKTTGALPSLVELEGLREVFSGGDFRADENVAAAAFRLEIQLRKLDLGELPDAVLLSIHRMLLPLKRQIIRIEEEIHARRR